jgi:hypothetical protein
MQPRAQGRRATTVEVVQPPSAPADDPAPPADPVAMEPITPEPAAAPVAAGDAAPEAAEPHGDRQFYGRLRVRDLAEEAGIPLEDALARLRAAGLRPDPEARLRDLANDAGLRPHDIAAILRGP